MSETTATNHKRKPRRSSGRLRGVIWILIWLFALGLGVHFAVVHFVKPYVVGKTGYAINKFVVHGDGVRIDDAEVLSLFPVRIRFSNIRARGKDSQGIQQDAIFAETGIVTFDLDNLIQILYLFPDFKLDQYRANIHAIEFDNCELKFEMHSDSRMNFILFRPDFQNYLRPDNRPNQILIDRLVLRNAEFEVLSEIPDAMGLNFATRFFDFSLDSVDLGLDIRRDDIAFQVKGLDGHTNYVSFDTIRILEQTPIEMHGDFILYKMDRSRRANGETGTNLSLENLNFSVGNLSLALGGHYKVENKKKVYQLNLSSSIKKTKTTLDTFLKILPESNADLIRQYDVQGELAMDVSFTKDDAESVDPHIEIDFESTNASFFPRIGVFKGDQRVRDLYLSGRFSNGAKNNFETSFIEVDSIHARLGVPIDFSGSIRFDSIYDPEKIHLTTVFSIDTANFPDVLTMVDSIPHFDSGGQVQFTLSLEGLVKNFNLHDMDKLKYNGRIDLHDLKFHSHINNMPIRLDEVSGTLDLVRNHIEITASNPLAGTINSQNVNLTGVIYNIAQYVVRQKENLNPVWKSTFHIRLDDLGIDELADSVTGWFNQRRISLGLDSIQGIPHGGVNFYYDISSLTDNMDLDLIVESKNLDFSDIIKDNLPGSLQFDAFRMILQLRKGTLVIPELSLYNSTDTIWLKLSWNGLEEERMQIASSINFKTSDMIRFISHFGPTVELGKVHHAPISGHGSLEIHGVAIKGEKGDSIALALSLVDFDFKGSDPKFDITNLRGHTRLNQSQLSGVSNQSLLVDSIFVLVDGSKVAGQVMIKDWAREEFDLILNAGDLPLATIHKYLHLITNPDGDLELALERLDEIGGSLRFQTHLSGSLDTLNLMKSLLYASQDGEIHFQDIGFEYEWIHKDRPLKFEKINGNFQFSPAGISFDHFSGYFGHSNFLLTGSGEDILPFVFDHQPLKASIEFDSDFLDLTDVLSSLSVEPPDSIDNYEGRSLLEILYPADFEAEARIKRAFFMANESQTVEVDNLFFQSQVKDKVLKIDPLELAYSSGKIRGDLTADISDSSNIGFTTNFEIVGFPLKGVYPLLAVGRVEPDGVRFGGDFWVEGWIQDTLRNKGEWELTDHTSAKLRNMKVTNISVSNLHKDPVLNWDELSSGARFGIKTFLGLNQDTWLSPEPRGVLFHDSLSISDGVISVHYLEMQSNKLNVWVHGDYSLQGGGTHLTSRILRTAKHERHYGRPEYDALLPKDYSRSQLRPYLKYKLYSEKEKNAIAEERGLNFSEVDDGYYKVHSNLGYTLGTLPRKLKFIFAKNPNKDRSQSE